MSMFDFTVFDAAPLTREPFDFVVVPGFLKPEALAAINRDYPAIQHPGNYNPEQFTYGPAFQALLDELNTPAVAERFATKFGVDLANCPTTITVRRYCEPSDGNIHTDHWSKIVTLLIYFNENWSVDSGRLRFLRSADDIEDYAAEAPPEGGTLLAFRRSDRSFHGHKQFVGERRMLQMSWIKRHGLAQYAQQVSRFSTHMMKRLARLGART